MSQSLLKQQPTARVTTLEEAIGLADAVQHELATLYRHLARLMKQRAQLDLAAVFHQLAEDQLRQRGELAPGAAAGERSVPQGGDLTAHLPSEISQSWRDVSGSALLTEHKILALAVRNTMRVFSFYVYHAAHAADPAVAGALERFATKQLHYAAELRQRRRATYHATEKPVEASLSPISDRESFAAFLGEREAELGERHRLLAMRLAELGDETSAAILNNGLDLQVAEPHASTPARRANPSGDNPVQLLLEAQKPLECLSEDLQRILRQADEELGPLVEQALLRAIARLAILSARIGKLTRQEGEMD